MRKYYLSLILMLASAPLLLSQDVMVGLKQFTNTQFIREFLKLRESAETSVLAFKRRQSQYNEEDVHRVINAYNASAEYFNTVLFNIKNDLLDKQKRKFLVLYPHDYSKQIEADLYRAREFYTDTYVKEVTYLTGDAMGTGNFLAMLPTIITYLKSASELFKKIKAEMRKYNEKMLQQYLIEPYRFRSWDEIN